MTFPDHFSARAADYARYRPGYPESLFAWLAQIAPGRDLAWDCATGNGQAAVGLSRLFTRVIATDASSEQLRHAERHRNITYQLSGGEKSGLPAGSVQLVTVAQALHWLDRERFYAEARAVLAPQGVIAVWSYGLMRVTPAIDPILDAFYRDVVGPYWPPERQLTEDGYASVDFPFVEIAAPPFAMTADLSLTAVAGYIGTWSATMRYREARGADPVPDLVAALTPAWGAGKRAVRWPMSVRAGRV